jgi:uncharacterized protein
MKQSRFNLLVDQTDRHALVFNSFSRGFVELERNIYEKLVAGTLNPQEEVTRELQRGYFILDDDIDELKVLEARNRVERYKGFRLGLIVLPTLNCNFRCQYCFEEKRSVFMPPEIEEAVVKFIQGRAGQIKQLKVSWFGGEPLLAPKIIDRLAKRIIDLCEKHGVEYHSDMTTNGYLLNRKNIDWLKQIKVKKIQITLDGDRETHDQRRRLKNGKPTFDVILDNIKMAAGHFSLPIRLNIDRNNALKARNLLPVLAKHGLQDKVYVYYGIVVGLTKACKDYESSCLDADELTRIMLLLHKEAVQSEYDFIPFPYPFTNVGGCGAMRPDFFVVDPDGYLHKCLNPVGNKDEAIGHITRPIEFNPGLVNYLTWDPMEDEVCSRCDILPICSGGCLWNKLHGLHSCGYFNGPGYVREILKLYHAHMGRIAEKSSRLAGVASIGKSSARRDRE